MKFLSFEFLLLDHLERVPDIQMLSFIFKWSSLLAYQVMPLVGIGEILQKVCVWGGGGGGQLPPQILRFIVFVIVFGTYNSNYQYGFA